MTRKELRAQERATAHREAAEDGNTGGGYICKQCSGPSPMGVGYWMPTGFDISSQITECACGWSQLPEDLREARFDGVIAGPAH